MEKIILTELVNCLSELMDLISCEVKDHHRQVASAAYHLSEAMGITQEQQTDIVIAAALHDIGGLSLNDRLSALCGFEDSTSHAEKGYRLLSVFSPFKNIANIVKYHHSLWNYGNNLDVEGNPLPLGSQIVMLADRVAVMLNTKENVLNQAESIINKFKQYDGKIFDPTVMEAFYTAAKKDSFWLDTVSLPINELLTRKMQLNIVYSNSDIDEIIDLISYIIDFRSVFTATHSKGVAVVAEVLARLMGFSEKDCHTMKRAALLHDIGKLAIPTEILEKVGPLDTYERNIIRTHAYYTDLVLSQLNSFETIREWASLHHESINGNGYPFRCAGGKLSLGARIMKAADIFTALMEDRPYRKGMSIDEAIGIMKSMADNIEIDKDIVTVLTDNSEHIRELFLNVENESKIDYQKFVKSLGN